MEDAFRFAVLALFEANVAMCAEDRRGGRGAQHTILDVPAVLERPGFRRQVLKKTRDSVIRQWFEGYFQSLLVPSEEAIGLLPHSRPARWHAAGAPTRRADARHRLPIA